MLSTRHGIALALRLPDKAEAFLATCGSEHKPHAREFIRLAVDLVRVISETALSAAAERGARLRSEGYRFAFPTPALGLGVHSGKGTT